MAYDNTAIRNGQIVDMMEAGDAARAAIEAAK